MFRAVSNSTNPTDEFERHRYPPTPMILRPPTTTRRPPCPTQTLPAEPSSKETKHDLGSKTRAWAGHRQPRLHPVRSVGCLGRRSIRRLEPPPVRSQAAGHRAARQLLL